MEISFVGDIMLGRFVADKYRSKEYQLVNEEVLKKLKNTDFRIANLESPIVTCTSDDSLKFAADPKLLDQFKWVSCFSLSNNHINDFGNVGMSETIKYLREAGITYNGLFKNEYEPFLAEKDGEKVAIITCADMMNYEFASDCPYKTLRMNQPELIFEKIKEYKHKGYFTILFLHAGMLFSRYLNPVVREFAHQAIDIGAGAVIIAHSHCLGGYEIYKEGLIFNSLGDFLMDGSSFRRRQSCILNLKVENHRISSWSINPTITTIGLQTIFPSIKKQRTLLKKSESVASNIVKHMSNYQTFFKKQYKKEMILHSISTLSFEFKKRGLIGLLRIIFIRIGDVTGMIKRVFTDRSKMSYDSDAVKGISNQAIK